MRDDLNKLLCERERSGSSRKFHEVRRSKKFVSRDPDGDDVASREGMKARYIGDDKNFNENLTPLYGAVRKAVGRPWNKFYSELSQKFDMSTVINQHILVHLDQYLARKDLYVEGKIVMKRSGSHRHPDYPISETSVEFYVHPRDGIIKRNKHRIGRHAATRAIHALAAQELATRFRQLDDGSVLEKIGDIWFHFEMRDAPVGGFIYEKPADRDLFTPNTYRPADRPWSRLTDYERKKVGIKSFVGERVLDVYTGEYVYSEAGKPPVRYHATKRTASHKLLKQLKIVS